MDFPTQKVTIYHKNGNTWDRYILIASFRHTSELVRSDQGISIDDSTTIRFFKSDNVDGFEDYISKGDVIVNKVVEDKIERVPLTELQNKYGQDNVYKVNNHTVNFFDTELDHIKVLAV